VLWIRKGQKLFAGSGSGTGTRGYGSGSRTGLEPEIIKISNLIIMTLKIHKSYIFIVKDALKCPEKSFKIVGIVKE
jgi:hypothetical protein